MSMDAEIRQRIRDRLESSVATRLDELSESFLPKILPSLLLFIVLFATYQYYMGWLFGAMVDSATGKSSEPIVKDSMLQFPALLKFFLITGWPFAVLAFVFKDWNSTDAARVAFPTFAAVSAIELHHYGLNQCPRVLVLSVPFLATAAIGHAIGAMRRPAKPFRVTE